MGTRWNPVLGGRYEVSEFGDCRNARRGTLLTPRFLRGYKKFLLSIDGKVKGVFAHKLVLEAFGFAKPIGAECRHLDGDKGNNHLSNLRWGTPKENIKDAMKHGKLGRNQFQRLNAERACSIRRAHGTTKEVALHFGVSATTVWNIRNNKRWVVTP